MLKFVLVSFWDIKAVTMQASKTNIILHSSLHRFKGYLREGADMGGKYARNVEKHYKLLKYFLK
jgi:hypothetical protein